MDYVCRKCNSDDVTFTLTPEGVHYGKIACRKCFAVTWAPKPDNEKAKRPSAHRDLVAKYSRGYCELCLTCEDDLPPGRTLEGHHIVEYQDGGGDGRENVMILCTKCHKQVHWLRTYTT